MITLDEILGILEFEKETLIITLVLFVPSGALFVLGGDIYYLVLKPFMGYLWNKLLQLLRLSNQD